MCLQSGKHVKYRELLTSLEEGWWERARDDVITGLKRIKKQQQAKY